MTSLTETYIKWYVDRRRGRSNKVMWKNNEQMYLENYTETRY